MFKCEITGKMSKPLEKLQKVVIKTRPTEYHHWDYESDEQWTTTGNEIVKEVNATEDGVAAWNKMTPEQQAEFTKRVMA